ncbi:aminotransferase class IV [Kribbella catacumbae]|uniref:aminotransferase class IV n=1 Tax=Kribbella catacumbae TaxID=460086 RepID=UPI00037CC9E2|nr:aminotransferase class IV [Kribbella catacumbae]
MTSLQVADSFLVANGKVRGLDLHRRRFTTSCAALGVEAGEYFDDQVGRWPAFGRWFPRFELSDGVLGVQLRPAPTQGDRIRVSVRRDPRTQPRVKGPDLEVLGELRAEAAAAERSDEVLLVDQDGIALEGAYSALVWWEDGTFCVPPATLPILPSVTAELLRRLATDRGTEIAERTRTADDLADADEVWLVNALHGIRPVHAWHSGPIDPLPLSTAPSWQQSLIGLAKPL